MATTRRRARRWSLLLGLGLAVGAAAQPADSLRTDTLAVQPPADSLATPVEPRRVVQPLGPWPGRAVTRTPALTDALDAADLVADVPGAFVYRLSAPGRAGGIALDGFAPSLPALRLDGRPFTDLLTGASRIDLLPAEAVGALRRADGALGRPLALSATTRPFQAAVPVTELRYVGGQSGLQHASGTHSQTRRAPSLLGGANARLAATLHVATRNANGPLASRTAFGGSADGARERHSHVLGRAVLIRPGVSVELGDLYSEQTDGAQRGLTGAVFDPVQAQAIDGDATRKTIRNDLWATAWLGLTEEPLEASIAWTAQRWRYVRTRGDTLAASARRLSGHLRQPLRLGPNRLHLAAEATWDPAPADTSALFASDDRLAFHLSILDSLAIGSARLALQAGVSQIDDATVPVASARLETGPLSVGAWTSGGTTGRVWDGGLASGIVAGPDAPAERIVAADARLAGTVGPWTASLRAFGHRRTDARWLVSIGDTLYAIRPATAPASRLGASATVGWRMTAPEGIYAEGHATATHALDADASPLHRRDASALPAAWGRLRLGLRARGVGDGSADLDLALTAHGWTAFQSRVVEPRTALLALSDPDGVLDTALPTRGTLGAEATATFDGRATVFLRYENALATRLYDGARIVPGEPLPATLLRFGVFWAFLN